MFICEFYGKVGIVVHPKEILEGENEVVVKSQLITVSKWSSNVGK